jgi:hypothetical protein
MIENNQLFFLLKTSSKIIYSSKKFLGFFLVHFFSFGISIQETQANETKQIPIFRSQDLGTIPSVHQLRNIPQQDWSWKTLQSLSQKYNCATNLQNNPQQTIDRYEFAFFLQSCLDRIPTIDNQEDSSKLFKLSVIFNRELNITKNKIQNLENTVSQLEEQQFSPTTKLNGEFLMILGDTSLNTNPFIGYEATLEFNSSFTGKDALKIQLEVKEIARLEDFTDTFTSRLSSDNSTDGELEAKVNYQFPITEKITAIVGTDGVNLNDAGEILNPLSSSGRGALSRFGRRDPATMRAPGDAGIAIRYQILEDIELALGYSVGSNDAADSQIGLFSGSYSLFTQILVEPTDDFEIALAYVRAYEPDDDVSVMGATGSETANEPFEDNATSSDRLGVQLNWAISDRFELGGWFGYTQAKQQTAGDASATILNGAITLTFPDLFAENNLGGVIIGIPPVVSDHDDSSLIAEKTAFHIEALYRIKVNDNINVTPGSFIVVNPDTEESDLIWVGTIRAEFEF